MQAFDTPIEASRAEVSIDIWFNPSFSPRRTYRMFRSARDGVQHANPGHMQDQYVEFTDSSLESIPVLKNSRTAVHVQETAAPRLRVWRVWSEWMDSAALIIGATR